MHPKPKHSYSVHISRQCFLYSNSFSHLPSLQLLLSNSSPFQDNYQHFPPEETFTICRTPSSMFSIFLHSLSQISSQVFWRITPSPCCLLLIVKIGFFFFYISYICLISFQNHLVPKLSFLQHWITASLLLDTLSVSQIKTVSYTHL